MEIEPYTEDLEPGVKAFNMRLREGGEGAECFPETWVRDFPKLLDRGLYQESFLALETGQVRGGYHLRYQKCFVRGKVETLAGPQHMVSEGIVNGSCVMVGVRLLQHALQQHPLLYAVGMGGESGRLPRLLKASRWTLHPIRFYFKALNPAPFLANLRHLCGSKRERLLADLLRYSRFGEVALRILKTRCAKMDCAVRAECFLEFAEWTNELWEACKHRYSLVAVRDREILNLLYPASSAKFLRMRVLRGTKTIGWVVMLDTQMSGHKHFGDLRLGSIVDCLSAPEDACCTIAYATKFLQGRNVDLIVTNQASSAWCAALAKNGFLRGPSNFLLGLSPKLAQRLQPFGNVKHNIHMNRGDGDGPVNL